DLGGQRGQRQAPPRGGRAADEKQAAERTHGGLGEEAGGRGSVDRSVRLGGVRIPRNTIRFRVSRPREASVSSTRPAYASASPGVSQSTLDDVIPCGAALTSTCQASYPCGAVCGCAGT